MNVLIVDDDSVDRESIRRALKQTHQWDYCNVTEVDTVDKSITIIKEQFFDVILLDFNLPQRNGVELLEEIKDDLANVGTAIIMVSSSDDEKTALESINAGAQDFLIKTEISAFRIRRAIITAQARAQLEQELAWSYKKTKILAEQDSLTGLANRYLFDESLKVGIATSKRNKSKLALLVIDLDNFKFVNDNYGHDVGDHLLVDVVTRINSCLRGYEIFSRLGGDEFALTLTDLESPNQVSSISNRILKSFEKPFEIDGMSIQSSASIGIAIYPDDSHEAKELFKYADIAMYRAKKSGKNQFSFFQTEMQEEFLSFFRIESELHEGLNNDEFILYYQPVIDRVTRKIYGAEALIRWQHADKLIFPDQFIPIAEKSSLIVDIGRQVIFKAVRQLSLWNQKSKEPLSMSINLSPVQLTDFNLIDDIKLALSENKVDAGLINFELTETALFVDLETTGQVITNIKQLGCQLALDDFGTGFSSLSHLLKFPIDIVKIDKSLMPSFSTAAKATHLVGGLTAMIRSLDLKSTAEGVESENDLTLCTLVEADFLQGYYFDKPLTIEQFESKYIDVDEVITQNIL